MVEQEDLPLETVDDVQDVSGEVTTVKNFQIDSYGADYTVDSLVNRMKSSAFFVPPFQRSYVWNQNQASRFVESLLLGLPVPGVFVFRQEETGRHLVIDGQQRLKTLQYFYGGTFEEGRYKDKAFRLTEVREPWVGKKYDELDEADKLRLNDSIVHTTVFKQREPSNDDQSVYEVFERINTTGVRLSPQEVRTCVNFGPFYELLRHLNDIPAWRKIFGPKNERLKDHELILRFFAIFHNVENYSSPMKGFLNTFMKKYSDVKNPPPESFAKEFLETITLVDNVFGERAFRPERQINAAVFDSVMVGLARRLRQGPIRDTKSLVERYDELLKDPEFQAAYLKSTANEESVKQRLNLATNAFAEVK